MGGGPVGDALKDLKKKKEDNLAANPDYYNTPEWKAVESFKKENANLLPGGEAYALAKAGGGQIVDMPTRVAETRSQLDELIATADAASKKATSQNQLNEALTKAAEAAATPPDPTATKQDPTGANDELKRQKRLEALRAGLMSTIKAKTPSLGAAPLLTPAMNIYGQGLKTKLGL